LCLLLSLWREFPVRRGCAISRLLRCRKAEFGYRQPEAESGKSAGGERSPAAGKVAAAVILLIVLSGIRYPVFQFRAEDTSTYPRPQQARRTAVRAASPSAADYASFARETVTWGKRLREASQPVMPGAVHDALAGVEAGEKLSKPAADWPELRSELEDLLKKTTRATPQNNRRSRKTRSNRSSRMPAATRRIPAGEITRTTNQARFPAKPRRPRTRQGQHGRNPEGRGQRANRRNEG